MKEQRCTNGEKSTRNSALCLVALWIFIGLLLVPMHSLLGAERGLVRITDPNALATMHQEVRLALVIGNGAYRSSPLGNPVNDARDMSDTLQSLG